MAKINLDLLKEVYLSDSNISTLDGLIEEAITTIKEHVKFMDYNELYRSSRPLAIAYIALKEAEKYMKNN